MAKSPKLKGNFTAFESARDLLKLSNAELCTKLGYSANVWYGWLSGGKMPLVVEKYCTMLMEQATTPTAPTASELNVIIITARSAQQCELIETFCKGLGIPAHKHTIK